jgi:uncharacterized protein (DUF924 family)
MKDTCADILNFWFVDTAPAQWFQTSPDFDSLVRTNFLVNYHQGVQSTFDAWQASADGALALIILFDQFPRNMFRGLPQAYETDAKALSIARLAIERGFDQIFIPMKRRFFYLPFEHSENLDHQKRSVELFESMKGDDPLGYDYALRHMRVIEQFGRFPHRNKILGRVSTAEEIKYLEEYGGF